jgi:hypothetical protein
MKIYEQDFVNIHCMPDSPGIYAWYVIPNKTEQLQYYWDWFGSGRIDISGKGRFSESFKGHLESESSKFSEKTVDLLFLKGVLKNFAAPIYVGISKQSLLGRLNRHKTLILEYIDNPQQKTNKKIVDEDEESANIFAKRIADKILTSDSNSKISEVDLFVRAIVLPKELTADDLITTEFFLNRTIKPILGLN